MNGHIRNRYPTISLLLDWIIFFYVKQRISPMHRANEISYLVALGGNPAGF
jgi:hypothetical protein